MQAHPDFIFHLDEPLEQPTTGHVPLRGWVAAQEPIAKVRLCGKVARPLGGEERPDVRTAFPAFAFVAGFAGTAAPRDLREGALHFSFGEDRSVVQPLPPSPRRPALAARIWSQALRLVELARRYLSSDPRKRWQAALNAVLLEIRITRHGHFRRHEIERVLALFAQILPDAVVVQIGANDGVTGDPLGHLFANTQWTGLLVEPVPFLCETLRRRYAGRDGVHVEQAAIADMDGEAPIYRLQTVPGQTPEWFNQLATLNRDVLSKQRASLPEIDSLIVEERTPTARLETLLARHRLARIDLLVIDTEGHDYQILRQLDFSRLQPLLIVFEHQHLSAADKMLAYQLVRENGYEYAETGEGDALAWRLR